MSPDISQNPGKLCGRHLLHEIVKLCGDVSWSHVEKEKPFTQLLSQASERLKASFLTGQKAPKPLFRSGGERQMVKFIKACLFCLVHFLLSNSLMAFELQEVNLCPLSAIHTISVKLFFFNLTSRGKKCTHVKSTNLYKTAGVFQLSLPAVPLSPWQTLFCPLKPNRGIIFPGNLWLRQ